MIICFSLLKPFPLLSFVSHTTTLASGVLSPFKRGSIGLFVFHGVGNNLVSSLALVTAAALSRRNMLK